MQKQPIAVEKYDVTTLDFDNAKQNLQHDFTNAVRILMLNA